MKQPDNIKFNKTVDDNFITSDIDIIADFSRLQKNCQSLGETNFFLLNKLRTLKKEIQKIIDRSRKSLKYEDALFPSKALKEIEKLIK